MDEIQHKEDKTPQSNACINIESLDTYKNIRNQIGKHLDNLEFEKMTFLLSILLEMNPSSIDLAKDLIDVEKMTEAMTIINNKRRSFSERTLAVKGALALYASNPNIYLHLKAAYARILARENRLAEANEIVNDLKHHRHEKSWQFHHIQAAISYAQGDFAEHGGPEGERS